jgi:hypothetical protein
VLALLCWRFAVLEKGRGREESIVSFDRQAAAAAAAAAHNSSLCMMEERGVRIVGHHLRRQQPSLVAIPTPAPKRKIIAVAQTWERVKGGRGCCCDVAISLPSGLLVVRVVCHQFSSPTCYPMDHTP